MKKLLMIAYHFHPDQAIGAVRTIKFAKYLPKFGWQARVLTVDERYYTRCDGTPLGFEVEVYRTGKWPVLDEVYKKVKSWLTGTGKKPGMNSREEGLGNNVSDNFYKTGVPLWKRMFNSLSRLPDDKMGWIVPGVLKAVKVIRTEGIDVIYSSGPPHTCHVIALMAKLFTGKKWVADFRDPWTTSRQAEELETAFSRLVGRFLEKRVIASADLVVASTSSLKVTLSRVHGEKAAAKSIVIFNGFDVDDFQQVAKRPRPADAPFNFVYAGNLYKGRTPEAFLSAVGELIKGGNIARDEIRLRFFGALAVDTKAIKKIIGEYKLSGIIEFHKPVPRSDYFDLITNAEVLVLIQASNQADLIPAKTFEYLATDNYILALVPRGAAYDFLRDFDKVALADLHDKEQVKAAIMVIVGSLRKMDTKNDCRRDISGISREKLTGELAAQLNLLAGGPIDNKTGIPAV